MPFSSDTDTCTGVWYCITGSELGELTYYKISLQFTTSYWHGNDHAHVFKNFPFSDRFVIFFFCGLQEEGKIWV